MKNNTLKIISSLVLLSVVFFLFIPYFGYHFSYLRETRENEANIKRDFLNAQYIQKKIDYLMGKFDPALRKDFTLVPARYILDGSQMYLKTEAYEAYVVMYKAALKDNVNLKIASATRNFEYQTKIWNIRWLYFAKLDTQERFKKTLEYIAAPGTSRHHWGTDIDLNDGNLAYFDTKEGLKVYTWLSENASRFGFCQTYNSKNNEEKILGYKEEKWHWSYMPMARKFTQEYKNLITNDDIKGFLGDEYVLGIDLINNYVLNINPDCI